MLQLPPIPSWDSLHPLIVHFPIVLLLLSPLFILISMVLAPPKGRPYMTAALIILLLGTASLFLATETGEAGALLAERGGGVDAVLAAHQRFASETEIVFSVLAVILLGMVLFPRILRRPETRLVSTFIPLAFLFLYTVGVLFLVNTADAGARLVHEFGIRAVMPAQNATPPPAPEVTGTALGARVK